jgi:outer membrane protein TolC
VPPNFGGLGHHVEKNFILGAEVLPGIDLSYGRSRSTTSNNNSTYTAKGSTRAFGYNLGSSWVILSAAYKF